MDKVRRLFVVVLVCCFSSVIYAIPVSDFGLTVKGGKIEYQKDKNGNRILDYSYCGYNKSESEIPDVKNSVFVPCLAGDSYFKIQKAIDYISSLKPDKKGFRGAVLLDKGVYTISHGLVIKASGVVLRGTLSDGTIIKIEGVDRMPLINIIGRKNIIITDTLDIKSDYIPLNSRIIPVSSNSGIKKNDRIMLVRYSNDKWIKSIGCDQFGGNIGYWGWKGSDYDIMWDRQVLDVSDDSIKIDAPLSLALDAAVTENKILKYTWNGRINNCGVENISLVSAYDKAYPKDEDHCWTAITIENAMNCWVRKVNFKHFSGSAVVLQPSASMITVEDCISKDPISEDGGLRRRTFYNLGQLNLFQRCYSEHGRNDFAVGYCAPGPNAFVQCESYESLGFSGPVSSWACGLLYDVVNIDGNNLAFKNLGLEKYGAGWNTANSMFWQCSASQIECYSASEKYENRAFGCWAQFKGNGKWASLNDHVSPWSLFYAQLKSRLGRDCSEQARILPVEVNATSSPTVQQAMKLAKEAYIPKLTLEKWIDCYELSVNLSFKKVRNINKIKIKKKTEKKVVKPNISVVSGHLTINGALMSGGNIKVPWWRYKLKPSELSQATPHVTRFVPDRFGTGFNDYVDSVVDFLSSNHILSLDHNYGLWYDRRRDDHERVRRINGDVWAPFYEQPFKRSGKGKAWDGLSKYDLTRPNEWYWKRLREFADKAENKGVLLMHQNYFQHNILEAGAHWVDCPWRPVNNINGTTFPEPVPFAGDKRVFMADMFYDVSNPVLRELHRNYIRMCLNNFADNNNVVQLIGEEFTGPLHFVKFWIDVISEWEKETGKKALVALSVTKDVQDSILNDPERSKVVDIIDIKYWHYKVGGIYNPGGGENMAPRQHMRKMKRGKVSYNEAYKSVLEYRKKYPDKAVMYHSDNYPAVGWAVLMAGGSCPCVNVKDNDFLVAAAKCSAGKGTAGLYEQLVNSGKTIIIYSHENNDISVSCNEGEYTLKEINPRTGVVKCISNNLIINGLYAIHTGPKTDMVYWFERKK